MIIRSRLPTLFLGLLGAVLLLASLPGWFDALHFVEHRAFPDPSTIIFSALGIWCVGWSLSNLSRTPSGRSTLAAVPRRLAISNMLATFILLVSSFTAFSARNSNPSSVLLVAFTTISVWGLFLSFLLVPVTAFLCWRSSRRSSEVP